MDYYLRRAAADLDDELDELYHTDDEDDGDYYSDENHGFLCSDEEHEDDDSESNPREDEDEDVDVHNDEDVVIGGDDEEEEHGDDELWEEGEEEEELGGGGVDEMGADGGEARQRGQDIGGEAGEIDRSRFPNCPICFRPWAADGPHRICCFPCGHVYGRACLEEWLRRSGDSYGKCPQCNRFFMKQEIINLYAPSVLISGDNMDKTNGGEGSDGCSYCSDVQERVTNVEARMSRCETADVQSSQEVAELRHQMLEVTDLQLEVAILKSERDQLRNQTFEIADLHDEVSRLKSEIAEMRSEKAEVTDLRHVVDGLKSEMVEMRNEMTEVRRMFAGMRRMHDGVQVSKRRRPND